MPIRISLADEPLGGNLTDGSDDLYISTGHIRTAMRHPDGAVVIFHDGTVTAGPWHKVCRTYPQPMRRVFSRQELDLLVDTGGVAATAQLVNTQLVDWVII